MWLEYPEHTSDCNLFFMHVLDFTALLSVCFVLQSTLFILTWLISNSGLSRRENLVPVSWNSNNNIVNIVKKRRISNFRSQNIYSFVKCGCSIYFSLSSANLICRGTDISKYFRESFGLPR